jgi:hypothetical protein
MVLKVLKNDVGYYSWWASSIYYAVDNGANVINMSLGGDVESQALNEAIQYALDRNVVVIVSMGNKNSDNISYPSNYPGVIAVGATNPDDSRTTSFFWSSTSGSNYGEHISVVAPGNFIYGLDGKHNGKYNLIDSKNPFLLSMIDLFEFLLIKLNEKGTLVTIAANLQFKDMDGTWHVDGEMDKTSLILLLAPEYEKGWDGSFWYKDNNKDKKIDFKSGRLIKLQSNILHKANAFNKKYKQRFSIKFEYYKN